MVQKRASFWIPLRTYVVVMLIEFSHEAPGWFGLDQNFNYNSHRYYRQNTTFIPTVEDYDPDYPYEQLLQLVKDTKRIISSSDFMEKRRLNFDPEIYTNYLNGDLSEINMQSLYDRPNVQDIVGGGQAHTSAGPAYFPPASAAAPPLEDSCLEDTQYKLPRRLPGIDDKDYFIINVGNDLKQQYSSVICKNPAHKCGPLYGNEDYGFHCEQDYSSFRPFLSIPVGNQISVEQQRIQLFKVPNGCFCKDSRIVN